jgi:hypothetical protein
VSPEFGYWLALTVLCVAVVVVAWLLLAVGDPA